MKYTAIFTAALFLALALPQTAAAQNFVVQQLEYGEGVTPVTAVRVALSVEKERVVPGPYARYAQKYLGAMPPLSERTTYRVTGAAVSAGDYTAGGYAGAPEGGMKVSSNVYNPTDFVRFQPDRVSAAEMTAENMAREAANTIFTLRKRRFDLVTGEAGEYVYGAGLGAAIEELARMEEEYVSLFMGKTSVEITTEIFEVVPQAGQTNYIVCRFSPEEGLLPENDLSAGPVVLTVTAERSAAAVPRADKKTGNLYRVASWAQCTVAEGTRTLATKRLPIFQFGETVYGK